MEKAPGGTSVGVDDPFAFVDRCDFVTDDGRCRWAIEYGEHDPEFAGRRSAEGFRCPVADGEWDWEECPHFRCRNRDRACVRCGLQERRMAHSDERPLLEEHHLAYRSDESLGQEITVYLCRWCHAKVHRSWARVDDDANPDPAALAERERRRSREVAELSFDAASDRFDLEDQ